MSSVPINKKEAKAPPPPPSDTPVLSETENRKISAPKYCWIEMLPCRDFLREIQTFNKAKLKHINDGNDASNKYLPITLLLYNRSDNDQSVLMQRRMRVFQESSSSDSDSIEFSD